MLVRFSLSNFYEAMISDANYSEVQPIAQNTGSSKLNSSELNSITQVAMQAIAGESQLKLCWCFLIFHFINLENDVFPCCSRFWVAEPVYVSH